MVSKKYNLESQLRNLFENSQEPLCYSQIESSLNTKYNKTSVYRQLEKLLNNGVLNKLETNKGSFYELKSSSNNHLHTHCKICNDIKCIADQTIKPSEGVSGFVNEQFSLVIEGLCGKCSKQ